MRRRFMYGNKWPRGGGGGDAVMFPGGGGGDGGFACHFFGGLRFVFLCHLFLFPCFMLTEDVTLFIEACAGDDARAHAAIASGGSSLSSGKHQSHPRHLHKQQWRRLKAGAQNLWQPRTFASLPLHIFGEELAHVV